VFFLSFAIFVGGYFIGSIPFGSIIAKIYGIDILKNGSGSSGATNVKRVVGKNAGNLVFILDAMKGMVAIYFPYLAKLPPQVLGHCSMIALAGALMGHSFSPFLKFRGGKGVAVAMGGLLLLAPNALIICLITWLVTFYMTSIVSFSSICCGLILPLCTFLFGYSKDVTFFSIFICLFIIVRHKNNIRRLIAGTEYRFRSREN
jgi:glycerol-3-phosphate acyltransferase PlsY